MASNIAIQISSNVQQAVNGINAVNQRLEALQKDTESVSSRFQRLSSIAGGATIVFNKISQAFQKASAAVRACVEAYSIQEQAERRLQTVLTATQDAVGMSAQELFNLAESLQAVTAYSDQEIIAVEQMLAATRKIGREMMPEATMAVLDMAAAIGDDAAGAAKDLAQALSDPAGEIESLKEKGIQLTDEQAENIKKVQEQNGLYSAQRLLLQEVAETYGGMAKAIADTDTGKLEKIGDVWQDIKEGLGEGLLNAIGPALDALYEKLLDIDEWIESHNEKSKANDIAFDYLGAYVRGEEVPALSSLSDMELRAILDNSRYAAWSSSDDQLNGSPSNAIESSRKWFRAQAAARRGEFNPRDMELAQAIEDEISRRVSESLSPILSSLSVGSGTWSLSSAVGSSVWLTPSVSLGLGESYAADYEREQALAERRAQSSGALSSFLDQYGGLSTSRQVSSINDAIKASQSWMGEVDPNSDTYKQLKEINEALYEQRNALLDVGTTGQSAMEKLQKAFDDVDQFMQPILSIGDSFATIMQNMADSAADKLLEIEEKWDEYFDDLDEKQERQSESLNAMLASGNISYEDYIDAMNELDESRAEAEEEAQKEKEEQQKKANELGQAAFIANQVNSIAEASMNIAQGVTEAMAQGGIAGIALGSIVAAAGAAQIAAIASQQYTPMAAGGIVTSPTHALIGEGGSPEAIIPLNDSNADRFGLTGSGSGVINITVNIGTAYSSEQISEDVFRGIERAQRTGALPHWRYA